MYEVIRTRIYDKSLESDIIKFFDDFDEMARYVRRFNQVFTREDMTMILTYREKGSFFIRSIDKDGYPRFLNERKRTTT